MFSTKAILRRGSSGSIGLPPVNDPLQHLTDEGEVRPMEVIPKNVSISIRKYQGIHDIDTTDICVYMEGD
jgi:hypothetical protein